MGARLGLSGAKRLATAEAYHRAMQTGCRVQDTCFAVFAVSNSLPHARLGLAVSRRVSRKAVVRNRIKRHIRESFRAQQDKLAGMDIVVLARAQAAQGLPQEAQESLRRHWATIIKKCKKP